MRDIRLEKFSSESDFEYYFQLVSDERVMAMVTERAIPLEEAQMNFQTLLKRNSLHPEFGNFKVFDVVSDAYIGMVKLAVNEADPSEAEVGYLILPQYWGKGYGNTFGAVLVNMAKEAKTIKRLTAIIDPKNQASRRILHNNGFAFEKQAEYYGLPGELLSRSV